MIYDKKFCDFVLKCDVKMSDPCNSGIFFRIENPEDPVNTGFEIQVATGKSTDCHAVGSIYDLVPTTKNTSKGAGKWDHYEIRRRRPQYHGQAQRGNRL